MASSRFSLGYRSDIEGLRAVAVILVIAAHAGVSFVPGGFIGVDVFFVLSGYLISGLLIGQRANTGKLNLLEFYLRRFLRLAPALLVMLVVVACVVRVSIAPPAQGEHFLSAAAASLWLSNWHFWSSEIDYFSAALSQNMFLHTWSLSVEEQFYLIWPALILFCFAARATRLTNSALVPLCAGMFVIGLLSFAFSVVVSLRDPMAAYYLPMSRAWQFAAGGVALLITYRMRGNLSGITSTDKTRNASDLLDVLGWIGIALIFLSSILIRDTVDYPGFTAIVPTLGTCLVLIAGVKEGRLSIARFLSLRPLVWIGMISYSLYLWHWPSLRILEVFVPAPSALARGVAIVVAFGLAVVSYALVETPMRNQKWLLRYPRRLLTASVASVLLVAAFQLTLVGGNQVDSMSPGLDEFRTAQNDMPIIYFKQCDTWIESAELTPCRFHYSDGGKEVFFIGDSVGAQWFSAIAAIAKSKPHCPYQIGVPAGGYSLSVSAYRCGLCGLRRVA